MSQALREAVSCDLCGRDDPVPLVTKNGYRVVRCSGCDLVYVSPRLRPTALVDLYEVDSYQAHQARRVDETEHDTRWRRMAKERLALLERFQPARGALLDVGCSTGGFLAIARDGGWRVRGLDVSSGSVAQARARGFDVDLATLEDHPLPPASFQAVTLFDSIEHMPSPLAALRAVHALLADGGTMMLTTPNVGGLLPRITWQLFGRTIGAWEHPTPPGHIYQFSDKTLADLLGRAGFRIEHEATEAIALDHTVSELEEVLMDALKGKRGRPTAEDARVDVAAPAQPPRAPPRVSTPVRLARRAVRGVVRTGAWALTGAIAAPAPLFGRGDSLVVLARKD